MVTGMGKTFFIKNLRLTRINRLFCAGLVWLGLQHEVCWASEAERICPPTLMLNFDNNRNLESLTAYLDRVLINENVDPICLGQSLSSYFGSDSIHALRGILKSDHPSKLRERAALVLGGISANTGTVIGVLTHDLASERDERVFLARLKSIAAQLESIMAAEVNENVGLPVLMEELERVSRSKIVAAIDNRSEESANRQVAHVLRILNYIIVNAQPTTELYNRLLSSAAHIVAPNQILAPSEDAWRVRLLNDLQSSFKAGHVNVEPTTREALIDSMSKLIGSGDIEMRLAAYSMLAVLLDASVDNARADALQAILVSALNEPDARLRAQAVKLLGRIAATRGALVALLVDSLGDSDEQVRREAADALALGSAIPDTALPSLYAMANRLERGSPAAIRALSLRRSPETLDFLLRMIVAEDVSTPVDTNLSYEEAEQLVRDWDMAQVHALEQFGEAAIVPLAAMAARATDLHSQGKVYLALVNLKWLKSGAEKSTELEAALAPALDGNDESARQFALSLLARLRPYAGTHFSNERAEQLARRYLRGKAVAVQSELQLYAPNAPSSWSSYWRPEWLVAPEVATAIVAGNSSSSVAAQDIVQWLCAKRRHISTTGMVEGLLSMETAATAPVLAVVPKNKSKYCEYLPAYLLARIDTASDIDASVAMVNSLPRADRANQRNILVGLARSAPALPPASLAVVAARQKHKDPVQSLLARWIVEGKPAGRTPPYELESARASGDEDEYMRQGRQQWNSRALADPDPYARLQSVEQAGNLGIYGMDTVPMLISVMQGDEAIMVREGAAEALGHIGGEEALTALRKAQQVAPPKVAMRAKRAIERILKTGM